MDLSALAPQPGTIIQLLIPAGVAADAVADEVGKSLACKQIIGTDASVHVSLLRSTVAEEMALALEHQGVSRVQMCRRVTHMLEAMGLQPLAERHPAQLSGGQTRRLVLGAVAISQPSLLILAEPFAGLDSQSQQQFANVIRQLVDGDDSAAPACVIVVSTRWWPQLGGRAIGEEEQVEWPVFEPVVPGLQHKTLRGVIATRHVPRRRWWHVRAPVGAEFMLGPVDINVRAGTVLWLRGDNGAGKSTLLARLAGIDGMPAAINVAGLALQNPVDQVTTARVHDMVNDSDLLVECGLHGDAHPLDLSSSHLRVAQIAQIVIQLMRQEKTTDAPLILLDEPDTLLTQPDKVIVHRLIHRMLSKGAALIVTCHDPEFIKGITRYAVVDELHL